MLTGEVVAYGMGSARRVVFMDEAAVGEENVGDVAELVAGEPRAVGGPGDMKSEGTHGVV